MVIAARFMPLNLARPGAARPVIFRAYATPGHGPHPRYPLRQAVPTTPSGTRYAPSGSSSPTASRHAARVATACRHVRTAFGGIPTASTPATRSPER